MLTKLSEFQLHLDLEKTEQHSKYIQRRYNNYLLHKSHVKRPFCMCLSQVRSLSCGGFHWLVSSCRFCGFTFCHVEPFYSLLYSMGFVHCRKLYWCCVFILVLTSLVDSCLICNKSTSPHLY